MSSINDAFGQIGAAKIFTSSISNALNLGQNANSDTISELQEKYDSTSDPKQGATDLLLNIAEFCDIGKKTIIKWLANVLVTIVPALEIAVKAILLTNIKKMISCSLDPRIPDSWRTEGVLVNEKEIDPRAILNNSPYSKYGRQQYFGVFADDEDTVGKPLHSLSRATDMNAFIWYVKNCAKYVSPIIVENAKDGSKSGLTAMFSDCSESDSLYNKHKFQSDGKHWYLPGCTFKQTNASNTIFLCIDRAGDDADSYTYTIVPCTTAWTSVNWYKNRNNVNKSKPLFNLEYSNDYNSSTILPRHNFKFKILPAPFKVGGGLVTDLGSAVATIENAATSKISTVLGTDVEDNSQNGNSITFPNITSLVPKYAKFNEKGVYNKSGRYSIYEDRFYVSQKGYTQVGTNKKRILNYQLIAKNSSDRDGKDYYLLYDTSKKTFALSSTMATEDNLIGTALTPAQASKLLVECYTGKTVYEFNYDYIMSFKLFDSKVIATNMVNALLNLNFINPLKWLKGSSDGSGTSNDIDQLYVDNMIDRMIQSIIDEEDTEFTDCFYTFSNEEYLEMEEKTNEKLANGTLEVSESSGVTEVYNLLDSYSTDASLHEQTEIFTDIFTKVSEIMEGYDSSNGVGINNSSSYNDSSSSSTGNSDFITKAVKFLISALVNAMLTPKVLMLIQINQKLMGNDPMSLDKNYNFSIQDVLNGMKGILSSMIKEVIDTIQKELLRVILQAITAILMGYVKQLTLEYAKKWVSLLKQLLECFKFNRSSIYGNNGNGDGDNTASAIANALDTIDSADIDTLASNLIPVTNPC